MNVISAVLIFLASLFLTFCKSSISKVHFFLVLGFLCACTMFFSDFAFEGVAILTLSSIFYFSIMVIQRKFDSKIFNNEKTFLNSKKNLLLLTIATMSCGVLATIFYDSYDVLQELIQEESDSKSINQNTLLVLFTLFFGITSFVIGRSNDNKS